ncbi:hypothetical protein CVT26_002615 [Gymnopilus dilepis]|uniref:Uncharacterized protein n=1 Tax=Gymnopilus dilepis TaxID=231916 RepID=A0A409VF66_9AGAR|nr:hypothetical protein CVT26_002615 [Gymnopilus dilepis]
MALFWSTRMEECRVVGSSRSFKLQLGVNGRCINPRYKDRSTLLLLFDVSTIPDASPSSTGFSYAAASHPSQNRGSNATLLSFKVALFHLWEIIPGVVLCALAIM